MQRITVVGSGFAAVSAIRRLRRRLPQAELTLVAPDAALVYHPSMIWVPTGLRASERLRIDLQPFLRRHGVRHIAARATGLADGGRSLQTDLGAVANDALLIASGARLGRSLPGIEHAFTPCGGLAMAEALKARLAALDSGRIAVGFGANPAEPVAVRGGPMFELLFGLDTWLRRQGRRDRVQLTFFNAATEPGKRLGAQAVQRMLADMQRRGIDTVLGSPVLGFEPDRVRLQDRAIPADLILFMPGLTGPDWAEASGLPRSPGGFFQADAHCRVPGAERVYVAGDGGSFPGPDWMPKQAHMADLQARAAADNLAAELQGRSATATFRTELACIIDSHDRGTLVYRTPARTVVTPSLRLLHWAKRGFEWWYLRGLRG